ncbi:GIY-YIG nuclease family protein [Patescibacteria group bacterium]|jgi:DNA polymerase-3 subunit epsilon|nr:GIY-YIG nuclease family protein [Patescibacteria group bacterium]
MYPEPLVFVDVETTGSHGSRDRVSEVGLIRVEPDGSRRVCATLVNPECRVPPFITELTGITQEMVEDAPVFAERAEEIHELLAGAIFVAHNAAFDHRFLRAELRRAGIEWSAPKLCTARLSRRLYPGHIRHNLDTLITRHELTCAARHRALGDAEVLEQFLRKVLAELGSEVVHRTIAVLLARPTVPPRLAQSAIDDLSDGPGVYFFFGPDDELFYVGKSINVRSRVLSHFSSPRERSAWVRDVARIEVEETAGELGALLREIHHIQSRQPLYNRRSRKVKELVMMLRHEDAEGYHSIRLVRGSPTRDDLPELIGVAKSVKQGRDRLAAWAEAYGLCKKKVGAEAGRGACFGASLGTCAGACRGKVDPAAHNKAFERALHNFQMRAWPFDGPVVLTEEHEDRLIEQFEIDQWCLTKALRIEAGVEEELPYATGAFEYEMYKVLAKQLTQKPQRTQRVGAASGV